MALTITDVLSEYGSYYRNEGQGQKDIIDMYYQSSITHQYFNPMPTDQTQERRSKFTKSRVLQRFQETFTPVGGGTFSPATINLAQMKVDEQETLSYLEKSWLGFLRGQGANDRKQWPFVRWYMEKMLKQSINDYEINEVYKGIEGSITPGTATAAGASMNGLGKQITDAIAASKITPIAGPVGGWSTDPKDFVTEIETWVKNVAAVSNEMRLIVENELDYLFMSTKLRNRYAEGLRQKYQIALDLTGLSLTGVKLELPLADQNIKIVGLPSMTGSERVFMTPSDNRAAYDKKPDINTVFELESVDRSIKIWGDIWKGIGFWYPGYVLTNDQN